LLTAGASHGLDLALKHLTQPGDTILLEDPTYFLALDIVRDYDVRVVPVPVDEHGLDVEALERSLREHQPRLLYTIPIWHNPTGATLPVARRRRLIELARAYDIIIVADEVYQMLGDADHTPPPLSTFGRDRVLSLGSFSKILAPGLRLGWIECSDRYMAKLARDGVLVSGGAMNTLVTAIAQSALELGIQDQYLETMRELYARRRRCMVRQLKASLSDGIHITEPHGGFFVWLELPEDVEVDALIADARDAGLLLKSGARFSPDSRPKSRTANGLRLCFACHSETRIREGCERLSQVLRRHVRG
jgi:DNA-binding transcriptional MocR family regulator